MLEDDEVCCETSSLRCSDDAATVRRIMLRSSSSSCCLGSMFSETAAEADNEETESDQSVVGSESVQREVTLTAAARTWRLRYGVVSIIGRRREMEDAVAVQKRFVKTLIDDEGGGCGDYDFFGVFDGHGGSNVARFCRERMHVVVAKELAAANGGGVGGRILNWEKVMIGSFGKVDEEVNCGEMATDKMKTIGSTAVVAVVGEDEVVVANCGDSRAVICRSGVAVALSSDHKVVCKLLRISFFSHLVAS